MRSRSFFRRALALSPEDAEGPQQHLLPRPCTIPTGRHRAQEILDEVRAYARRHAEPLAGGIAPHRVRPLAGRRLRIGYGSADFREHPVVRFLEPTLAAHDHQRFEIVCYSDVPRPDSTTRRAFRATPSDHWRSLRGFSPTRQAAELIRARDGIDLLVDLAGSAPPGTGCWRSRASFGGRCQVLLPGVPGHDWPGGHGLLPHRRSCRSPGPGG